MVIAHRHPLTAAAADDEPLQQCRSFTWWTSPMIFTERPRVGQQALLVFLVLIPRDVARVDVADEHGPLITRQLPKHIARSSQASLVATVDEGAGIARVVQGMEHVAAQQRTPDQLSLARTRGQPPREEQLLS